MKDKEKIVGLVMYFLVMVQITALVLYIAYANSEHSQKEIIQQDSLEVVKVLR